MMKKFLLSILAILVVIPALAQQQITVTGTVVDETGEAMVGVIVVAKNAKGGTVATTQTDMSGKYSIKCGNKDVLDFHFLGFESVTEKASKRVDVVMMPDASSTLDAAVAIGFGAVKKADLAVFPAVLIGGLLGFLCYNFHPAKVFMGDTGSLFLGGAVCGMAFALDMPLILILVGLVYIVETLSVILQVGYFKLTKRFSADHQGRRIFKMTPIHHHFEMSGWSEVKIWIVFVGVSVVMCVIAFLSTAPLR